VRFGPPVLLTTEAVADEVKGGPLAESAWEAKILTLFGGSAP